VAIYPWFVELAAAISAGDKGALVLLLTGVAAPIVGLLLRRVSGGWESIGKGPLAMAPPPPDAEDPRTPAPDDPLLRVEVRQLVVASNVRRQQRGMEPLDVEAETRRRLTDLVGSR
jgi:hypothetical protein